MRVMFRFAGDAAEEQARSLHDWLLLDRDIRRAGVLEMASSSASVAGQQGTTIFDLVSLVLGNGISAASLGVSVASWRATRPKEPTITVERADGSKVTISGTSSDEARRLLEQLLSEQR
ncbi:effector-associated constant component EACC1 [Streptomyces sviceus]|uniref:effector-associated constant component EACC1 n=1 Tax=Streptomyces sviceus TaxID=285530 RepID=UPI003D9E1198